MSAELVNFLRARLDEDEQTAKASASAPWAIEIPPHVHVSSKARRDNKWKWGKLGYVATVEHDEDRRHIARHDPARVLAEVEAKRRLLDVHTKSDDWDGCVACDAGADSCGCMGTGWGYPCDTVKILALPYADHPDYREEWRPGN